MLKRFAQCEEAVRPEPTRRFRLYNLGREALSRGRYLDAILLNIFYLEYSLRHLLEENAGDVISVCCEHISYVTRHMMIGRDGDDDVGDSSHATMIREKVVPLMLRLKDSVETTAATRGVVEVYKAWCLNFVANVFFYLRDFRTYVAYLDEGIMSMEAKFGGNCDNHRIYLRMREHRDNVMT